MTKMHIIAKIALTVLGVNLVSYLSGNLEILLMHTLGQDLDGVNPDRVLACVVLLPIPFAIVYYLLFRSDFWVRKVVGPAAQENQDAEPIWTVAGFRLILFFCGIMIISGSAGFIVRAAAFLLWGPRVVVNMIIYKYVDDIFLMPFNRWFGLLGGLCKAALGMYLVLGARRFIRWQLKQPAVGLAGKDVEMRSP